MFIIPNYLPAMEKKELKKMLQNNIDTQLEDYPFRGAVEVTEKKGELTCQVGFYDMRNQPVGLEGGVYGDRLFEIAQSIHTSFELHYKLRYRVEST